MTHLNSFTISTIEPFTLAQVELLDSPFRAAMERNAHVLLELDADRLLHNTRKYAELQPRAPLYDGWEARGIAGHTLGHYLTAISQQYAATGDARFKERLDHIISEMDEAQQAYGDGYIGALPPLELETLRGLKQGIVELNGGFNFKGGAWVPWYTQHKVLAGLKDAWTLGKSEEAKMVTLRLADWVDDVTRPLSRQQQQEMLRVEFGGMEETLADIYALTGNAKYLETARRFRQDAILEPLRANRDELAGKHANTQIPKIIGEARLYEVAGDEDARRGAENFWNIVVHNRSWVIGGNSDSEHFFPIGEETQHLGPATAESCNTYNMLKLTRHLFAWQPKSEYFDFYERALYNHILASQDPKQGMFAYFMSLKPGHFKTFSTLEHSFWCCFGSGLENPTKYQDSIYFHDADNLWVNLFIPSRLCWPEKGLKIEQKTNYPHSDTIEFSFSADNPVEFGLKVRLPKWATSSAQLELNGENLAIEAQADGYVLVRRVWKTGDHLRVTLPMQVRSEPLAGDDNKRALLYGPLVLAGDLGPVSENVYCVDQVDNFNKPVAAVPALVSTGEIADQVRRVDENHLIFQVADGENAPVKLRPFNEMFFDYTNVYWDVFTPDQYAVHRVQMEAEAARARDVLARTLDEYRPGEQQSELDHDQQGENSSAGDSHGRKFRHAQNGGWFSVAMKVAPDAPVELLATYWGNDDGARTFDITVDGQKVATQTLDNDKTGEFFPQIYPLPTELTRGKQSVIVRFAAHPDNIAGGVFGLQTLRQK